jgi:hypothetical protein
MTMHQKMNMLIFLNMFKKGNFGKKIKFDYSLSFTCLLLTYLSFYYLSAST